MSHDPGELNGMVGAVRGSERPRWICRKALITLPERCVVRLRLDRNAG